MEILYSRCAGLDVHKKTVVATILVSNDQGQIKKETRSFETTTGSLLILSDWLAAHNITHVAMESTGEYTPPPMLPIGGGAI
jgi:transposase